MTPRSIWHPSWSTAPPTAPATSAAASTTSAASPPRSRKKIGHRSSLEFLDGGNADKAAPPPASPANKTKRKAWRTQRRMSPESKSQLDALSNLKDAASASIFGEGTDETTKYSVPQMKAAEPSKKRSVKTTTHGNELPYSRGKSKKCTSKEEAVQSVESHTLSSSQVTPKTNAANKPKHSPLPSFSPIDYRPQNHDTNDADCPETTSILKSYVEKWTKDPSDNKGDHQNELNDAVRVDGERNTKMEADSSSSVMSSSYEDDSAMYHDDTIDKSSQPILDSNDEQFSSSWENNVPSPETANKDLDVEYGRLAFIKEELERKMQVQKLDARAHGGVTEISERINPQVGQHFSAMSDRKYDMVISRESLEHEYSQLTFFKRQLERKMEMQNYEARNLDPWMPRASFPEVRSALNDNVVAIRGGVTDRDEIPSREDVAFGKMVYQQRMEEQGMINMLNGPTSDDDDAAKKYKGRGGGEERLPSHSEVGRNYVAKHHPAYHYKNHDIAYERSPSKAKTKKRRKRRVVETITRVIHEESEEEGSASTGHSQNLKVHRPRTGRSSSSKKRYGDDCHTVYRGNVQNAEPFVRSRERISLPGRDYNACDESESDSSQSLGGHERLSCEMKGRARRETKTPEKKRQKQSQGMNNRSRFHMSQPSTLESLH
ncbi:hypothetical protein ACHAW5_003018 [Stephanodiscus triporus]|uniref:Uncharacterized protein n=1 Tax=Stephanodiscus triporus TaxID=2934178 RepID=A0ABD3N0X0_9STRA